MPGPTWLILYSKGTGGLLKVAEAVLLLAGNSFTGYYNRSKKAMCFARVTSPHFNFPICNIRAAKCNTQLSEVFWGLQMKMLESYISVCALKYTHVSVQIHT